ncbi:MAG: hypothetical protein ACM3XS_06110 [Bacteroidota bacterium]
MKTTRLSMLAAGLVILVLAAMTGLAANPLPVTVNVPAATTVAVNDSFLVFDIAAFDVGPTAAKNISITAHTNKKTGYIVSVAGEDFAADGEGDASTFPLSTLQFYDDTMQWRDMTTTSQAVHTGAKTGPGGDTFNLPVRLNLSGNEASGQYTTSITVTIASP